MDSPNGNPAHIASAHATWGATPKMSQTFLAFFEKCGSSFNPEDNTTTTSEPPKKKVKLGQYSTPPSHHPVLPPTEALSSVSLGHQAVPFAKATLEFSKCPQSLNGLSIPVLVYTIGRRNFSTTSFDIGLRAKEIEAEANFVLTTCSKLEGIVDFLQLTVPHRTDEALPFFDEPIKSRINPVKYDSILQGLEVEGKGIVQLIITASWDPDVGHGDLLPKVKANGAAVLSRFFPRIDEQANYTWTPQDFYQSVHVPSKSSEDTTRYQPSSLRCHLYPFQQRTVRWMLSKESVDIHENGDLIQLYDEAWRTPPSFSAVQNVDGSTLYVSHLFNALIKPGKGQLTKFRPKLSGGILAEEMGLGKTVELISLICLHRRKITSNDLIYDDYSDRHVLPSGATLIIAPKAILQQWKTELARHAPDLKVVTYSGMPPDHDRDRNDAIVQDLLKHDVVLVAYHVAGREIYYAQEVPKRSLRNEKKYVARRSPLVQISWWRVCLDEAQMVESGVSAQAQVARMIPRCNAWAVTGTPVRKDVKDLLGLLVFLRYHPFCETRIWNRLVSEFPQVFASIFSRIALRNTKRNLGDELQLPPQKRAIVRIPFTAIEEQHYKTLFQKMCDACGFDEDGKPLDKEADMKSPALIERMRAWLARLRQTCLHPEVGTTNRRALGHRGDGPLRTVAEVLEVLISQAEAVVHTEELKLLSLKLEQGQVHEVERKPRVAIPIYQSVFEEIQKIVLDYRQKLNKEIEVQKSGAVENPEGAEETDQHFGLDDYASRLSILSNRVRAALEIQHTCEFFFGNAYFLKKVIYTNADDEKYKDNIEMCEEKEAEHYDRAKKVRLELLAEDLEKVEAFASRIRDDGKKSDNLGELPQIQSIDLEGIEVQRLADKCYDLTKTLNNQSNLINEWRQKVKGLLLERLVDQEEDFEISGEEYDRSADQQHEIYEYMAALKAVIADRNDILTIGRENDLTKRDVRQALWVAEKNEGECPELVLTLLAARDKVKPTEELGSMKSLISDIKNLITVLKNQSEQHSRRAAVELTLAEQLLTHTQQVLTEHTKLMTKLDAEHTLFRSSMNARLEYYRQLQQISRTLAPYDLLPDKDPTLQRVEEVAKAKIAKLKAQEEKSSKDLTSYRSNARYLVHLRQGPDSNDQSACIICTNTFEIGVVTSCGHVFCKECILTWSKKHQTCPTCVKKLHRKDLTDVTYVPRALEVQEEGVDQEDASQSKITSKDNSVYAGLPASTLAEIQKISLPRNKYVSSFGTKIDTIARHLIWLRSVDPGAKTVIFSQYRDFLDVLLEAFSHYAILATTFDAANAADTFCEDPRIEAFLLHAKAAASGLTLVAATHVLLTEPLVNPALELQAVARVHRIGQTKPTSVWMYLVSESVEEAVYDISVKRRLAHGDGPTATKTKKRMLKQPPLEADEHLGIDVQHAESWTLQSNPLAQLLDRKPGRGEMVGREDVWTCLFATQKKKNTAIRRRDRERQRAVEREARAQAAEQRIVRNNEQVMVDGPLNEGGSDLPDAPPA